MNILEYLQKRHGRDDPKGITKREAKAFGIHFPLRTGWLFAHGKRQVTDEMIDRLNWPMKKLKPKKKKSANGIGGPVTIIRLNINQKYEPTPPKYKFVDPLSPDFLTSYAWTTLRMQALKKYGAVCMCCGDSPANGAVMNVDHIKPRKHFPNLALDINNLQILCSMCNKGKGNWDSTDWRPTEQDGISYDPLDQLKEFVRNL